MTPPIKVVTDKRGFATKLTPVSNGGMLRHARSIDDLLNNTLNGEQEIKRLLSTAPSTLTISGGTITTTLNQHIVAAETGTMDDLTTIAAANNKFVFIRADAGDTITLKHAASNIYVPGGNDLVLTGYRGALLFCDTLQWSVVAATAAKTNFEALTDPGTGDDSADGYSIGSLWLNTARDRMWICVDNTATTALWKIVGGWVNGWGIRAAAATAQPIGIAAPTITAGATGNANDANDTLLTVASTASSDNQGIVTATFDLVRPCFDPVIEMTLKTGAAITGGIYVGLTSVNISGPTTALAGGTKFIGFRLTSSNFKPVLCDGSTQTDGSNITTATTTFYRMRIRVNSSLSTAYYSINGSAEQALTTGFPLSTTDMGAIFRISGSNPVTAMTTLFGRIQVNW